MYSTVLLYFILFDAIVNGIVFLISLLYCSLLVYRNVDFVTTLLSLTIGSNRFLHLQSLGIFMYKIFRIFIIECVVGFGFLYVAFILLRSFSSIPSLFSDFYHERMSNILKCFLCIYWDDYVIFSLCSVMCCIMLIYFHKLTHPCVP